MPPPGEQYDIDFTVMSYDVGYEKPDKRIFEAAEGLLATLPAAAGTETSSWDKLYVGDEYEKDVVGARNAGWSSVLLSESGSIEGELPDAEAQGPGGLLRTLGKGRNDARISSFSSLANALGVNTSDRGSI